MHGKFLFGLCVAGLTPAPALAVVTATTTHSVAHDFFASQLSNTDLIAGQLGTELDGDTGWHPANPASIFGSADQDGLPVFTDGINNGGVSGLLNDFPPSGQPTKLVQYDLAAPTDIGGINILTGNQNDSDGRAFSTFRVLVSTDNGSNFDPIGGFTASNGINTDGYFESDPLGTVNGPTDSLPDPDWRSTFVEVFDDAGGVIAAGVTNIQFHFYGVDNSQGEYRDPFDGVNPFTGVDDQLTIPNTSPIVWEIDVIEGVSSVIVGDYNESGQVEQGDLDFVLQNWGDTDISDVPGWTNFAGLPGGGIDGQVEQTELDLVLSNWGDTSAPNFTGSAVPEPAAASLLVAGMFGLRRRWPR